MNKKNQKTIVQIKFSAVTIKQRIKLAFDIFYDLLCVNKC